MSLETMTKIGSYTVPSNTASFTMSNIPQGYTDLLIKLSSKTLHTSDYDLIYFLINGDTTATNYNYVRLQGEGNTSTTTTGNGGVYIRTSGGSSAATNFFGTAEVTIYNYSGSAVKSFSVDSAEEINASGGVLSLFDGIYSGVAPVTSLTFYPNNATIAANTTVTLYGMKNAQKTAGNSIKATGGNIVFDGTYVYHVFNSTDTFAPTQPLTAEVLVTSGGGSGSKGQSGTYYGFGGGAGEVQYFSAQSLVPTSYTCTIGAGGSSITSIDTNGNTGSASRFGALTNGTGGGGALYNSRGGNSGNGFTGGNGFPTACGGGAGSAQNGFSATSSSSAGVGAGGNGTSSYSSLLSAVGVGQNVSGTWYIAGGGGGTYTNVVAAGGYGGANAYYDGATSGGGGQTNKDGDVNTGSGGSGGGDTVGNSGSGGSGVIIVRYKG